MLIFCFRCRTYFINHIIFKLKLFIFFKTCKKTVPSETTFRIFPRKINPGQNKILLILDTAQPAPDEFNVVFVVGNKVFHVEEYKLLKNDIFQIGKRPLVIFRETTLGFPAKRKSRFAKIWQFAAITLMVFTKFSHLEFSRKTLRNANEIFRNYLRAILFRPNNV